MNKTMLVSVCALVLSSLMSGCGDGGGKGSDPQPATFKISGTVTSGGVGLPNATVKLGGAGAAVAFTNSSGNYLFSGLANGDYTVATRKVDYSCQPKITARTVSGADLSGVNFSGQDSPPVFYVADDTQLAVVDVAHKTVRIIGNTGTFLNDIAFDPNGNLFGISGSQLFSLNPTTGAATAVGSPTGLGDTTPLVFSDAGTLYTATTSLCTVSPLTGLGVTVGSGGDPYRASGDLAFLDGTLYLSSAFNLAGDSLVRLNPANGAGTLVGPVGFPIVYGLASNDDVSLYGFSGNKVIRIDPATGAGTLVWDINGLNGLGTVNGAAFH
jgi:hypothetical protein